jgi:sugar phosphate isomerase/epimerase
MGILSLGSSTLFNATPLETLEAAAAAGFDAVGIRVTGRKHGDGSASVTGNAPVIRELRRRRDDTGVAITHVTAYWATPELTLAEFTPVIDTAADLGASMIGVNCGYDDEARFVSFMAAYCEAAAKSRLRLLLEFMPFSGAKTLAQALRMLEQAGQPNLGLMVDPLHLARGGETPADLKKVDSHLIYMVQLCDAPPHKPAGIELRTEALSARLYPGEGGLPLHDFLDAVSPDVQIDVEAPHQAHARLTPVEQARMTAQKCRPFLAAYHDRLARHAKRSADRRTQRRTKRRWEK